jgi:hypothetical protein
MLLRRQAIYCAAGSGDLCSQSITQLMEINVFCFVVGVKQNPRWGS